MDKVEGFLQSGNFLELNKSLFLPLLLLFSCSVMSWDPREARQASLSITNSRSLPKLTSIESVMPSDHLILCRPLLLPPSIFPSIRVFSSESVLRTRWPKDWSLASLSVLPVNIQGWSTSTLTKFWVGKSEVESRESDITLISMSCLFLLMSLETESRNIERKDTLTDSRCRKGLCVAHATQEFQSPLIYLVEYGNEITEPTVAEGSVWLLNAEGVIIFSMCGSSYQKLTVRVGWGRDLHFLFFIIETCFFFFSLRKYQPVIVQLDSWICLFCFIFI